MSLVGKFVYISRNNHYRTGEVVQEIIPELYLIKFDWDQPPAGPMELYHCSQMIDSDEEGIREWGFFDSRKELDDWLKWLDTPAKPQVIHIVKDQK